MSRAEHDHLQWAEIITRYLLYVSQQLYHYDSPAGNAECCMWGTNGCEINKLMTGGIMLSVLVQSFQPSKCYRPAQNDLFYAKSNIKEITAELL